MPTDVMCARVNAAMAAVVEVVTRVGKVRAKKSSEGRRSRVMVMMRRHDRILIIRANQLTFHHMRAGVMGDQVSTMAVTRVVVTPERPGRSTRRWTVAAMGRRDEERMRSASFEVVLVWAEAIMVE